MAQREVAAQVFVSNSLRSLRMSSGEPLAVISAHRADALPSHGELRLTLTSPYAADTARTLRCPLYAQDRLDEVVAMLHSLLRDCRVTEIRVADGIQREA